MADLAIDLRDVRKAYGAGSGKTEVLRGVSFAVEKGDFVALVGQSGSGKSTLLNIVGGLDVADGGEVEVLGCDYRKAGDIAKARLRNRDIGFVFQSFNLLDHLDCLGNVTLPESFSPERNAGGSAEERALEALRKVGLAELARRRPTELSGGQKQRVAIARALFNAPQLLLCDEPTGNLDSETGRDVIEFFQRLNADEGTTLLVVTHEDRVSGAARRITRIRDGVIVEGDSSPVADGDAASVGGDAASVGGDAASVGGDAASVGGDDR